MNRNKKDKVEYYKSLNYKTIIKKRYDFDGSVYYVARHKELVGLVGIGNTPQTATKDLKQAKDGWLGWMVELDKEIPLPTKKDTPSELQVYNAGHILNEAMVAYREKQHKEIDLIEGVTPYSPHKDESINDKANAIQENLAERIVHNDFKAMRESDIFVFDVLNEGLGTIAELGILLGMKHHAKESVERLQERVDSLVEFYGTEGDEYKALINEISKHKTIIDKPVFCYCSDIRQGHKKPYIDPDRAEFSTNQFVYGTVLELTGGKGFSTWDEILKELKNIGMEQGLSDDE